MGCCLLTVHWVELFQILKDGAVKVLHSICQQIWKTQQWPQDWKRSVFIPIPNKDNAKECSNWHRIALISHASKVMLKILQARLQQYVRSIGPAVTREQSPAFLRNSNGRLDFPGPTQEASWIPSRNSWIPPQLEKNHVVPPSSQDEALSRYSVSGEVPR